MDEAPPPPPPPSRMTSILNSVYGGSSHSLTGPSSVTQTQQLQLPVHSPTPIFMQSQSPSLSQLQPQQPTSSQSQQLTSSQSQQPISSQSQQPTLSQSSRQAASSPRPSSRTSNPSTPKPQTPPAALLHEIDVVQSVWSFQAPLHFVQHKAFQDMRSMFGKTLKRISSDGVTDQSKAELISIIKCLEACSTHPALIFDIRKFHESFKSYADVLPEVGLKFKIVASILSNIKRKVSIGVVCQPGLTIDLFATVLEKNGVSFQRKDKDITFNGSDTSTSPLVDCIIVPSGPTGYNCVVSPCEIIFAIDGSIDFNEPQIRRMREREEEDGKVTSIFKLQVMNLERLLSSKFSQMLAIDQLNMEDLKIISQSDLFAPLPLPQNPPENTVIQSISIWINNGCDPKHLVFLSNIRPPSISEIASPKTEPRLSLLPATPTSSSSLASSPSIPKLSLQSSKSGQDFEQALQKVNQQLLPERSERPEKLNKELRRVESSSSTSSPILSKGSVSQLQKTQSGDQTLKQQLQKEKQSKAELTAQVDKLNKDVKRLERGRKAAQEQVDFVKNQYETASQSATKHASENQELSQKVSKLEKALSEGLEHKDAFLQEYRSDYVRVLSSYKSRIDLLLQQNQRLNSRFQNKMTCLTCPNCNNTIPDPIEVYHCEWQQASKCTEVFLTKEALKGHLYVDHIRSEI